MSMEGRLSAMSETINQLVDRVGSLEKEVKQLRSGSGKSGADAKPSSSGSTTSSSSSTSSGVKKST